VRKRAGGVAVYGELGYRVAEAWGKVKMVGAAAGRCKVVTWAVKASKQGEVGKREHGKGEAGLAVVWVDNSGGGEGKLEARAER
jgi:hypothetical protein